MEPIFRVPSLIGHPNNKILTREDHEAFFQRHVAVLPGGRLPVRALYDRYVTWCTTQDRIPWTIRKFLRLIEAPRVRSNGTYYLEHVTLMP